ncbi:hypothetical protein Tco_1537993 [Tanacetum coccineum]
MTHHHLHHHDLTTTSPSLQHHTSTSITTLSPNLATKSPKPLFITLTSPSPSTLLFTLAQALAALKSVKPNVKANIVEEPSVPISAASTKVSARLNRLQQLLRILTPRKELSITKAWLHRQQQQFPHNHHWKKFRTKAKGLWLRLMLITSWLKDCKLKNKSTKRAEDKRNKPTTKTQQKKTMITYLKNIEDMDTELVEGSEVRAEAEIAQESSSKRAGTKLEQESIKKQKVDEDKETAELQRLIEVVLDKEEVAIDAIPLATKPPSIVDYKIHKEGKKTYYQIIRADGSSKMYLVFSHMLKSFDREDLETLWKLVKAKHGSTRPEEGYERVLWGDLKTMFDPHVEDQVWRNQQDYRVLDWKIYDSCGVHSLRMQHMHIHMLVEKRYPLTPATITDMLNKKLQCDHFSEMVYQLLKLLTKTLTHTLNL